jgi:regulator of sirC expression with transglutaminase-like and TPR domain
MSAVGNMSSSVTSQTPEVLTESRKAAFLNLLTDDDPAIYQLIRGKILAQGQGARDWLRAHTLSSDPVLRRRAQEIIDYFERQSADNRFVAFCLSRGEVLDIEQGAWLLAQTQYPNINVLAYQALLDSYAADLRTRIDFGNEPAEILATINDYLFGRLSFGGNEQHYYEPDNSYLNRVLDRRKGNPISLCTLYLGVARRLRLPVTGIGMPGHFLCRFQSSREELYIDSFHKGKLLTKAECIKRLVQSGHEFNEGFLAPMSPRRMLLRMCTNLHQIYITLGLPEESSRLQRYIVALQK